ncbi:MAG: hypothetical protein RL518_276 [Pseudomonadota bacterium]|jgi:hypothetical protein
MFKIKLSFCSGSAIELLRVDCTIGDKPSLISVRGKTNGAYQGAGTFQWSSAVRAVACIFLRAKLLDQSASGEPMLSGEAGSLAASLDYAITKQPAWITDMFGISALGEGLAKRLFRVTNSHRKRGGPVAVSLNLQSCSPKQIEVVFDHLPVVDPEQLRAMLKNIETRHPQRASSRVGEVRALSPSEPSVHGRYCRWPLDSSDPSQIARGKKISSLCF